MGRRTLARVYRCGDACIGEVEVPRTDGEEAVIARASAPTGAAALIDAANLADALLANPLLAAVVPPQATAAIAATRHLAEAAEAGGGILRRLWKSIRGPGKKRLAKAIMRTTPHVVLSDMGATPATIVRDHRKPRRSVTMGPSRPRAQSQQQYGYPPDPYGGYYGGGYPPQGYPPPGYPPPGYGGYPPQGYGGYPPQGYYPPPQPQPMYYDPAAYGAYGYNPYLTPAAGGYAVDPMQDPAYLDYLFASQGM